MGNSLKSSIGVAMQATNGGLFLEGRGWGGSHYVIMLYCESFLSSWVL